MTLTEQMTLLAKQARAASRELARLSTAEKNLCLLAMADALLANKAAIQEANTVLLVVTPEKTAILDIANILPALSKHFGSLQKFKLVLNQFDEKFGLDAKQVVGFLNGQVTILGNVPYAPVEARLSINQGEPLVLQKALIPAATAIVKLASQFYPPLDPLLQKRPATKGPGLFRRSKDLLAS